MAKKYVLTIEYDEDTEEIEYISEEMVIKEEEPFKFGDADISEYFDDELLDYIRECYIIGKA
jgi:hypothetical protein